MAGQAGTSAAGWLAGATGPAALAATLSAFVAAITSAVLLLAAVVLVALRWLPRRKQVGTPGRTLQAQHCALRC